MNEKDFFEKIDGQLGFMQAVYGALGDNPPYYSLHSVKVEHSCGGNKVWVYVERSGVLWLCDRCQLCGTI